MKDDPDIKAAEMDMLKELGNIGLGNATISLSRMLNHERINMEVPEVSITSLADIPDLVGGAERPVTVVFSRVMGEVSFYMIYLMPVTSAKSIIEALTLREAVEFCDLGRSVIREVGNIVGASFLNALSFMTHLTFLPTPPILAIDMAEAILNTIFAETIPEEDSILFIKTAFSSEINNIEGYLLMIPNREGLQRITEILGIGDVR